MENPQKRCKFCNELIDEQAIKCKHCGSMLDDHEVYEPGKKRNGLGITGFVLSLLGLIFCWVPVINWIFLVPGFLLSFAGIIVGATRNRRLGHSITGIILSVIGLFVTFLMLRSILTPHAPLNFGF